MRTDHCSLKHLLDQRLSTIPQHTWVSTLFGYSFQVEYKPGKMNAAADALSRRDEQEIAVRLHSISRPEFELFKEFRRESASLPEVLAKRQAISAGSAGEGWSEVDGFILYQGKIFLPDSSAFWPQLLDHAHGTGHEGVQKTLVRLRASFYSPRAAARVREYIRGCLVCQRNKTEHLHPAGLLQPLDVPSMVWSDISMDFVEGFPRVGGKSVVLTVVDRLSKMVHFVPLGHPYTALTVAQAFFDNIVKLHGFPSSIVSDRDPVFTSTLWLVSSFVLALHFGRKRMGSQRLLTGCLVFICGVWLGIVHAAGSGGFLGLNIVSTRPTSRPCAPLLSRWYMAVNRQHWHHISPGWQELLPWTNSSSIVMCFFQKLRRGCYKLKIT